MNIVNENIKQNRKNCSIHSSYIAEFLHISQENQTFEEICFKCWHLNQQKYDQINLIHINDLIDSKEESFINNFPPLSDEKIQVNLSNSFLLNLDDQIQKIRNFFEELKDTTQKTIKKVEAKVNDKIDYLLQMKQNLIETYNAVSSKEQIKQIYLENSSNLLEQLNEILKDKFLNIVQNTTALDDQVKKFQIIYDHLDLEQPKEIQNYIVDLLESTDFFSNFDSKQIEENKCKKEIQEDSYVKTLLDLICNKTNYCTDQFISHIKEDLIRNRLLLNRNKFNCQINDKIKYKLFNNLQQNQLEDVRQFCHKILKFDKENQYQLSKISNFVIELLRKSQYQLYFSQNNYQQKISALELERISSIYYRQFFISDHKNCKIFLEKDIKGVQVRPLQDSQANLAYTDILKQDSTYIIRISKSNLSSNRFGLIKDSDKNLEKPNFLLLLDEKHIPNYVPFNLQGLSDSNILKIPITGYEIQLNNQSQRCFIKCYPEQITLNSVQIPVQSSQYRFAIQPLEKVQIFDFYEI